MEVVDHKKKVAFIACKGCKWTTPHPNSTKRYSTTKMQPHLDECTVYNFAKKKTITDRLIEQGQRPFMDTKMTTAKLTHRVMNAAIHSNLSWSSATNPAWSGLLQEAWPDLDIPNRRSVAALLDKKAKEGREDLKERLRLNGSKISLALDGWSVKDMSFQGTAPCIGQTPHCTVLAFCPLHTSLILQLLPAITSTKDWTLLKHCWTLVQYMGNIRDLIWPRSSWVSWKNTIFSTKSIALHRTAHPTTTKWSKNSNSCSKIKVSNGQPKNVISLASLTSSISRFKNS